MKKLDEKMVEIDKLYKDLKKKFEDEKEDKDYAIVDDSYFNRANDIVSQVEKLCENFSDAMEEAR